MPRVSGHEINAVSLFQTVNVTAVSTATGKTVVMMLILPRTARTALVLELMRRAGET
jgi:hypothetical protein